MGTLKEAGIIWIDESETYVADKTLFETAEAFLGAVISHIKHLVDNYSEEECGWYVVPSLEKFLPRVCTSWMVHRINSEWHDSPFWELIEESGRGHRPIWLIDFEDIGARYRYVGEVTTR